MTSLAWKLNRLRVMSVPEVAHRGYRWCGQRGEQIGIHYGWQPRPKGAVGCGISLFAEREGWLGEWNEHFSLDETKLNELLEGRLDLFSYEGLAIGQPVDWYRDPLTGIRAPLVFGKTLDYRDETLVGNVKVLWELGRHQHLIPLAVAYACSGQSKYRDAVVGQIDGWVATNPYGVGIHWCSALEAGLRLIAWSVIHSLLVLRDGEDGLFSASSDRQGLGRAIYQQAWFVRHFLSRYSSANNHLIGELAGLFVATRVFDLGVEGNKWSDFARQELEQQARQQVYADGVNKEQAIYYHLWVLEYFLFVQLVARRAGQPFSAVFEQRILAMSAFLRDVSTNQGEPPQIGDADDGFVTRFEPGWPSDPYQDVQCAVAAVFAMARSNRAYPLSQKGFWYGLMAGVLPAHRESEVARERVDYPIVYDEGGYAILGDDRVRLIFDAGSLGYPSIAAHGHADALSVCLALNNEWWLIDPGTFSYHSDGEWRDYFRGTTAHNTVVINDLNQSTIGGSFLWLSKAPATLAASGKKDHEIQYVEGYHDGYRPIGVRHRRKICYRSADQIVEIVDRLESANHDAPFRVAIYYHFAPETEVSLEGYSCQVTKPGSRQKLKFSLAAECTWSIVRGATAPIQGWYSSSIGVKVPAAVLVGVCEGPNPGALRTSIAVLAR